MFVSRLFIVLLAVVLIIVFRGIRFAPWPLWVRVGVALLALASTMQMILIRMIFQTHNPWLPEWFMAIAGATLSICFMLFILVVIRDVASLILWLFGAKTMAAQLPYKSAIVVFLLAAGGGLWSYWEAVRIPSVREVTLEIPRLDPALDGLRIAHLTDLHIGPRFRKEWVQGVVERTNEAKPDLIAITGDMVDGSVRQLKEFTDPLTELTAPYGVFFCSGNHEYFSGLKDWLGQPGQQNGEFSKVGATLHSDHKVLNINGVPLVVAAVTDPRAVSYRQPHFNVEHSLAGAPKATTLLLAHRPETIHNADKAGVALQLSGHTHGGLSWLFDPITRNFNGGFIRGEYQIGDAVLYLGTGTGLWGGFPFRFGVPSEIALITVRAKK